MKKLFVSLSVIGMGLALGAGTLVAQTYAPVSGQNPSCMQAAIRVRDEAFIDAFSRYSQSITAALRVRQEAQVSAWDMSDPRARQAAIVTSEINFTASYNDASRQLTQSRIQIRQSFDASARACHTGGGGGSTSSAGRCTAYCPDGTAYNSCVVYFADPCRGHYLPSSSSSSSSSRPVLCEPGDCGPMLGMPNWLCPDGSLGGPSCELRDNGRCGYVIRQCPVQSSSSAMACQNISGSVEGSYTVRRNAPDAGVTYDIHGSATLGVLGTADANGSIQATGFFQSGRATGVLILTNAQGSVTLALTGPTQPGFAPPPTSMTYSIQGATGAYAGMTGRGALNVSFTSGSTFRMAIQAMCS